MVSNMFKRLTVLVYQVILHKYENAIFSTLFNPHLLKFYHKTKDYFPSLQNNVIVINNNYILFFLVDKMTHMVGSYPPKMEVQSYTTPSEDAPSGMMARGSYTVHSLFTDDDKNEHLKWEWVFEIKKDWKDN